MRRLDFKPCPYVSYVNLPTVSGDGSIEKTIYGYIPLTQYIITQCINKTRSFRKVSIPLATFVRKILDHKMRKRVGNVSGALEDTGMLKNTTAFTDLDIVMEMNKMFKMFGMPHIRLEIKKLGDNEYPDGRLLKLPVYSSVKGNKNDPVGSVTLIGEVIMSSKEPHLKIIRKTKVWNRESMLEAASKKIKSGNVVNKHQQQHNITRTYGKRPRQQYTNSIGTQNRQGGVFNHSGIEIEENLRPRKKQKTIFGGMNNTTRYGGNMRGVMGGNIGGKLGRGGFSLFSLGLDKN